MRIKLHFNLPRDAKAAKQAAERLGELVDLIREDKEEQAIDPAFFTGNIADYPSWLREAHGDEKLIAALERFGECEPGELEEWDLESWYEDFFAGEAWDVALEPGPATPGARRTLAYSVEGEHYGGDLPLAWIAVAAGGTGLEREEQEEEK